MFEPSRKHGQRWDLFGAANINATQNLLQFNLARLQQVLIQLALSQYMQIFGFTYRADQTAPIQGAYLSYLYFLPIHPVLCRPGITNLKFPEAIWIKVKCFEVLFESNNF